MLRDLSERELSSPSRLSDYRVEDGLEAGSGKVFLTGTQALVRLPLMQRQRDAGAGLNTAGFISGYRGSPLGGYDQALWQAGDKLEANDIRFLAAVNEELGATAVLGSQQVETDPQRTVDGVFAIWYGKGPGLDRAGDALRHGNALGSSPHGGVLVVVGDDHGCVSSSMPHQSEPSLRAWSMPVLNPASVAEMIEYGLYGWALSRYSGAWVGLKAISETVESATTVDLDRIRTYFPAPSANPPTGLHYRPDELPSLAIEERLATKLDAVRAFARVSHVDKLICTSRDADIGIVTCGKAHLDLLEALDRLDLSLADFEAAGVRLYKIGLSFPVEETRIEAFACGLKEILVVEEKAAFVEQQIKELLYNHTATARPAVIGKRDLHGKTLLPATGELRPSRIMPVLADWLARHKPALDRRDKMASGAPPEPLSNAGDRARRVPYFCPGCPHNISTKVPAGSQALAGIGCHFMASWMDRSTGNLVAMGGEGVHWVSRSMFSRTGHVFQNMGDGTYFHSGTLAIRQAIAADVNITFKILYNESVAMTGGQPIDGTLRVVDIARQVADEGARRVVVVSDEPKQFRREQHLFPAGTSFHHRSELDAVQRQLCDTAGVTVLIYAQTCASEKRRRTKQAEVAQAPRRPDKRLVINSAVCEDCGECTRDSNCLAITPVDTPFGRKRRIAQSACSLDYACDSGSCPSFVSVIGGEPRRPKTLIGGSLQPLLLRLPEPTLPTQRRPYNIVIAGVGGTGVATLGALLTMAAHLEGRSASVLDFKGFAQKGGAILSYVRLGMSDTAINQGRIDTDQADALLACDLVVGAGKEALRSLRTGHGKVVANTHHLPGAAMMLDPDADPPTPALLEKIRHAAGPERIAAFDAHRLAEELLGDAIHTNMIVLGYAWQNGLVPLTLEALERAIELNGVAVAENRLALGLGRLAAADPAAVDLHCVPGTAADEDLHAIIDRQTRHLTGYQNEAYAQRYQALVAEVEAAERPLRRAVEPLRLTQAVARNFAKLLAYKDEYEVARLHTETSFASELQRQFQGDYKLRIPLSVPFLRRLGIKDRIAFGASSAPILKALAKAKFLRGTRFDLFGRTAIRKAERGLAFDYEQGMKALLPTLAFHNLSLAEEVAALPERIRGFGEVKLRSMRVAKTVEAELLKEFDLKPMVSEAVRVALESPSRERPVASRKHESRPVGPAPIIRRNIVAIPRGSWNPMQSAPRVPVSHTAPGADSSGDRSWRDVQAAAAKTYRTPGSASNAEGR
jgi:indolepyruvate ferredoxin oxidoreductase